MTQVVLESSKLQIGVFYEVSLHVAIHVYSSIYYKLYFPSGEVRVSSDKHLHLFVNGFTQTFSVPVHTNFTKL